MDKPKENNDDAHIHNDKIQPKEHKEAKFDPNELVIEDEEHKNVSPKAKPKKGWWKVARTVLVWLVVLAIIAGAVAAGIVYFLDKSSKQPAEQTSQTQPAEQSSEDAVPGELTETYDSTLLRLSFKYPSDWTVNEVDRGITVESPEFQYQTNDGESINGSFKLYIRKGARSVDGNYLGKGFAIGPSEEISYNEPVSGQREDTYLSAFGLNEPDNFAYFIVQGNIKIDEGDTLGPDFAKEPDAYLIFGGYTSQEREDDLATNTLSIDTYANTSEFVTAVEIVKSLQLR